MRGIRSHVGRLHKTMGFDSEGNYRNVADGDVIF